MNKKMNTRAVVVQAGRLGSCCSWICRSGRIGIIICFRPLVPRGRARARARRRGHHRGADELGSASFGKRTVYDYCGYCQGDLTSRWSPAAQNGAVQACADRIASSVGSSYSAPPSSGPLMDGPSRDPASPGREERRFADIDGDAVERATGCSPAVSPAQAHCSAGCVSCCSAGPLAPRPGHTPERDHRGDGPARGPEPAATGGRRGAGRPPPHLRRCGERQDPRPHSPDRLRHRHPSGPARRPPPSPSPTRRPEMRSRVEHLIGEGSKGMWVGTFHSHGARSCGATRHHRDSRVVIYDEADARGVAA